MLRDRLGVSERWACRVCGQHRSTERYEPKRAEDDAALRAELRTFSVERPRWGYRRARITGCVRRAGSVNRKRVQRRRRAKEGLRVPQRTRKRRRLGESTVPAQRLRAERPESRVGVRLPVRPDRRRAGGCGSSPFGCSRRAARGADAVPTLVARLDDPANDVALAAFVALCDIRDPGTDLVAAHAKLTEREAFKFNDDLRRALDRTFDTQTLRDSIDWLNIGTASAYQVLAKSDG